MMNLKLNLPENFFLQIELLLLVEWIELRNDKGEDDNLTLAEQVRTLPVVNLATEESVEHFSTVGKEVGDGGGYDPSRNVSQLKSKSEGRSRNYQPIHSYVCVHYHKLTLFI